MNLWSVCTFFFNGLDPGSLPTVKCQACNVWSHRGCVDNPTQFRCASCIEPISISSNTPRASESHYRTELNHVAAARGLAAEYHETSSGPLFNVQWTSIVYGNVSHRQTLRVNLIVVVNRIEYGRGYGRTKGGARENAAGQAVGLIAQGY